EVLRHDVVDRDVAGGDSRKPDEARDLDVFAGDPPFTAAQPLDATDGENVRADPVDLGAKRPQEAEEVLAVGLPGPVADPRPPGSEGGRHDCVLGRHHARLVEEDPLPDEAGPLTLVSAVEVG